jgi:hypothetical protein
MQSAEKVWKHVVGAMLRAADELAEIGESEQATAMKLDAAYIHSRAVRHLKNLSKGRQANDTHE